MGVKNLSILSLSLSGFLSSELLSSHSSFDLICIEEDNAFNKMEVKGFLSVTFSE